MDAKSRILRETSPSDNGLRCYKCSHPDCGFNKCTSYSSEKNTIFSFAKPSIPTHLVLSGEDQLSKLSDEVLLSIFRLVRPRSCLAAVAGTCRRFAVLCRDESLWQRLDLAFTRLPPESLFHILSRGVRALRLNTTVVSSPAFSEEQKILCRVGKLWKIEFLDFSNAHIHPQDLATALNGCRCLLKLSLESCDVTNCAKEIALMPRLNTLNLAGACGLTKNDITLIVKHCTKLKELNISWTELSADALAEFCKSAPTSLTSINLAGAVRTLTNVDIERLTLRCRKLVELDVSDCWKISGDGLQAIARNCADTIEGLSFSRCYKIRLADIMELCVCKRLRRLNMFCSQLTDEQWQSAMAVLTSEVKVNQDMMSDIARPTVGLRRTSIWGVACRLD